MSDFMEKCAGCGACAAVCPFLTEYGTPDLILSARPDAVFRCTACGRCDAVCPLELSPAAALFEAKQDLVRQGRVPPEVQKGLDGARGFARVGHRFPFSFYRKAETVFWPGCGLAAQQPGVIAKIRNILSRQEHAPVGLVLDCCHDPAYGYGDTDTAFAALERIKERLHYNGVRKVITGCLNCYKLLSTRLEDIPVVFILSALPSNLNGVRSTGPVFLHHPCPSSRWDGIRSIAEKSVLPAGSPPGEGSGPLCCGSGGGLSSFDLPLADRFLEEIVAEKGNRRVVTYCIGCQNRFLQKGIEAAHLLEDLTGITPRKTVASPLRQWTNRFFLALSERLKTRRFPVLLSAILLVAGGVYLTRQYVFTPETLAALLDRHPLLAPLIFLGIYAVAPAVFLPSIPLTLAAGFFWGPLWGVVFSISGATLGACLPFFLSRYLFQEAVKTRVPADRWQWLQDRVVRHGWKAVAFTRLIPLFPFNLLNYLFGLTPIPFSQYLWSTFVFMLPACVAFVAFGSSLGELILRGNLRGVLIGVFVAATAFCLPLVLRPYFRGIGEGRKTAIDAKDGVGKQE